MTDRLSDPAATADRFSFGFFAYGVDETQYWTLPEGSPLADVPKVGIYLIRAYEATYLCSLRASSFAEPLRTEFVTPADAVRDEGTPLGDAIAALENEASDSTYLSYVTPNPDSPWQSPLTWFDVSPDDLDLAAIAADTGAPLVSPEAFEGLDLRDLDAVLAIEGMREVWIKASEIAWEEALESFNANWRDVPAAGSRSLYDRLKAKG